MKAMLFDLDDTLYRERRWALSGFEAVARYVATEHGVDTAAAFCVLRQALASGHRRTALQRLGARFGLPMSLIPQWVEVMRCHEPRLRLSGAARQMLVDLRPAWKLGVITNGLPSVQTRKVRALGLTHLVDTVVYAHQYGAGKPDPQPFLQAATQVGVAPTRCVFVGNDRWTDVYGARRVGMHTVRVAVFSGVATQGPEADTVVPQLDAVAPAAEKLIQTQGAAV